MDVWGCDGKASARQGEFGVRSKVVGVMCYAFVLLGAVGGPEERCVGGEVNFCIVRGRGA